MGSTVGDVAVRSIRIMVDGDLDAFTATVAPGAVNHESRVEPLACRAGGPAGFHASAVWLRTAFSELAFDVDHVVVEDDLAVVGVTMRGRHTGPFVIHDATGGVDAVQAPTGASFAVAQSHWLRVADQRVTEHWATRDDLGQGFQLGWVPPTPLYLLRCAAAKRRAVRRLSGA